MCLLGQPEIGVRNKADGSVTSENYYLNVLRYNMVEKEYQLKDSNIIFTG